MHSLNTKSSFISINDHHTGSLPLVAACEPGTQRLPPPSRHHYRGTIAIVSCTTTTRSHTCIELAPLLGTESAQMHGHCQFLQSSQRSEKKLIRDITIESESTPIRAEGLQLTVPYLFSSTPLNCTTVMESRPRDEMGRSGSMGGESGEAPCDATCTKTLSSF